jgi:hypothetical protein
LSNLFKDQAQKPKSPKAQKVIRKAKTWRGIAAGQSREKEKIFMFES